MSADDLRRATLDQITLLGHDRESVMRLATEKAREYEAGSTGPMFLRMHPDAHDRFIPRSREAVPSSSTMAPTALQYRCNLDQDLGALSISYAEVEGDFLCE